MTVYGWDASDFDWSRGPMDVGAAARDGIVFFTHKATEGTRVVHQYYGEALSRARSAGIPFLGAYVVPRTPGNNGHGTVSAQVDYFLSYLDTHTPWWRTHPGFFLQVDLEHWGYDDVPAWVGVEACRLLRERAGKWVVLYAPRWAYGDDIGGNDPLWASSYGTNPAVPYRNGYPGDGSSMWVPYSRRVPIFAQYGSRLTIGTQGTCDGNAFRGSIDQLRAIITGGGLMTATDNIIQAFANGMEHGADGEIVSPVTWRIRDEAWQASVSAALADLKDQVAAVGATISPEQLAELKAAIPTAGELVAALVAQASQAAK